MKIFLAGATGALGRRLLPRLVNGGHQVVATTRTPDKANALRTAGAEPVILDALNRKAVMNVVQSAKPDVVVHQLTALRGVQSLRNFDRKFALTNRLRTEGTANLLAAAQAAGARRFIAQSYTGWPNTRTGGRVKTEEDPFDADPPKIMRQSLQAIRQLEEMVSKASGLSGIVLRYGGFYGPGNFFSMDGGIVNLLRKRHFPIVGSGAGVWSFIHIDDAASATIDALENGPTGVYNIVDDEPAEVSTWLPELAKVVGAPPPRRFPAWLGRLVLGESGVSMMTQIRGSSNAKAKRLLHWQPAYTSWRDGFRRGFGSTAVPEMRSPSLQSSHRE